MVVIPIHFGYVSDVAVRMPLESILIPGAQAITQGGYALLSSGAGLLGAIH